MVQWLSLPGTANHNATTPDHADLDVTGDIDIRVKVAMDDWTPATRQSPVGKYESTGNQRSYWLGVETGGTLIFVWSPNGSTGDNRTSTAAVPFADGEVGWIRATLDVDDAGNRVTRFYTSTDSTQDPGAVSWTQLGLDRVQAGTTEIFASTENLEAGSVNGGTEPVAGNLYVVAVYNGINGTLVGHFDADNFTVGDSDTDTAVDSTGKTWTINGANSVIESGGVSGSLAETEEDDSLSAAGSSGVEGSLAETEDSDTLAASGAVEVSGTLAETEEADTLSATGTFGEGFSGTLAETEENDTLNASGTSTPPEVTGTLAETEEDDSLSAAGTSTGLTGSLSEIEADDTLNASGILGYAGTLAETETDDTLAASGTFAGAVTGTLTVTEADDTLSASGSVVALTFWTTNPVAYTANPVAYTPAAADEPSPF